MPKLPKEVIEIGKKYNLDSSADLWDCQGTWVVTHKALERIAAQESIQWHRPPEIVCSDTDNNVVLIAYGRLGDREEWSTGEASSDNYPKRGRAKRYPWAIAEKRAKDRVILKLINLAGYLYSEEESEEFKDAKPTEQTPKSVPRGEVSALDQGNRSNREVKQDVEMLLGSIAVIGGMIEWSDWPEDVFDDGETATQKIERLPEDYRENVRAAYKKRRMDLQASATVAA